jgi:hypothetical protein
MRNISRRQIRWGIWHLIQHDAADLHNPSRPNPELYAYVPLNPHSRFRRGYYNPLGDRRHPSYETMAGGRLLRIHYLYRVGKVAADSNAGWMAVVNGQKNIGFVENFKWFPGQEYPDDSSVASWNNGPGTVSRESWDQTLPDDPAKTLYYMESEVLSPYAELDPGEEYGFRVHWSPTSVTNPIVDVTWGGAISVPLKGTLDQGEEDIRLQGILGVFTPGELVVTFYSALGEELACQPLMQVDPREVARLDKRVRLPKGTFRASIFVRDEVGENRGLLANVVVNRR